VLPFLVLFMDTYKLQIELKELNLNPLSWGKKKRK
jgi:hypothetical protein